MRKFLLMAIVGMVVTVSKLCQAQPDVPPGPVYPFQQNSYPAWVPKPGDLWLEISSMGNIRRGRGTVFAVVLEMHGLVVGTSYQIFWSQDLLTWDSPVSFIATDSDQSFTVVGADPDHQFFRIFGAHKPAPVGETQILEFTMGLGLAFAIKKGIS